MNGAGPCLSIVSGPAYRHLGPVCISFSKMGKRRGVHDAAYETHRAYYKSMTGLCDLLLIENVPEYDPKLVQQELGPLWDLKWSILDPRAFGVPAARTRVYILAWRKDKLQWRSDVDMNSIIDTLTMQCVSNAGMFFWKALGPSALTNSQVP